MFKKIIISLLLIIISLITINITNAICNVDSGINGCLNNSLLVNPGSDVLIEGGFKTKILDWITKIGGFLGLMAVGAIVWGGFMMTISTGEEEKIKKAKDIVKWAIIGFVGIILASSIIALIVNFMYSI